MDEILGGKIIEVHDDGFQTPWIIIENNGKKYRLEPENGYLDTEYDHVSNPDFSWEEVRK